MDLNYLEDQIAQINKFRNQILREMGINSNDKHSQNRNSTGAKKYNRSFSDLKDLKIACIMDAFTFRSFNPECRLFQITPHNWQDELENFQPHVFFLESAWRGKDDLWNTKVDYLSNELIDVLSYCKKNGIPIVFWNKEDPVHFHTFIETAKHADFVFTTDIDCIKQYKAKLKHDRVYLMPFAAQTKYHNPIEKYERENKFCFAGAYYKRYPDRIKDLNTFIDTISRQTDVVIYDRNYHQNDPNYSFPKKYNKYIAGNLRPEEIDKAYKGYKFNINMNSVKQSQTMCARRIFELLASNTITFSNYSRAVRNLFGDLVICTDDGQRLAEELQLFNDPVYYGKFRLLGLRKILSEHTYHERLIFMLNQIYENSLTVELPSIGVMSYASNEQEINHIINQFNRQTYSNKKLFLITTVVKQLLPENVEIIREFSLEVMNGIQSRHPYLAFFSKLDYYGENYLNDFVLTLKYSDSPVMTKATYYSYISKECFDRNEDNPPYTYTEKSMIRKSVVKSSCFESRDIKTYTESMGQGYIAAPGLSIDEFNYCMNYSEDECALVDDLSLTDVGVSMEVVHNVISSIRITELDNDLAVEETLTKGGCFVNKADALLITDNYPDYNNLYRYAFIHTRLLEYKKVGVKVDLFKHNENSPREYSEFYGIDVYSGYYEEINNVLIHGSYSTIMIHFFTEKIWSSVKNIIKGKRVIVWIHGAEIQPWWRRQFNFTNKQQLENAKKDSENKIRFWKEIFNLSQDSDEYDFHFVFVSNYFAEEVFEDFQVQLPKEKYSVIHNYVNDKLFKYNKKSKEARKKILSIRPFSSMKYANDLAIKAILYLSKDPIFKDLEFRVIGQGELFKATVKPVKKFKNVILEERFLRQPDIAELHKDYGIFLNPTRWDSQGVSRDEAMSSGLVPITNNVSAIPEFADESCCMLVEDEDYIGLADSIRMLYHNPEHYQQMSEKAAARVRNQSSLENTILREVELIKKGVI